MAGIFAVWPVAFVMLPAHMAVIVTNFFFIHSNFFHMNSDMATELLMTAKQQIVVKRQTLQTMLKRWAVFHSDQCYMVQCC